jgi:hypothetical protein
VVRLRTPPQAGRAGESARPLAGGDRGRTVGSEGETMEFLLAAIGLAVAVWMIYSARKRHRDELPDQPPPASPKEPLARPSQPPRDPAQ